MKTIASVIFYQGEYRAVSQRREYSYCEARSCRGRRKNRMETHLR